MQTTPVHRFPSGRQTGQAGSHGNLDFSHISTSSYGTTTTNASSRRSKSFKEAAQHVAQSFVSCFVPFSRNEIPEHDVDAVPDAASSSTSASRRTRHRGGYLNDARDEITNLCLRDVSRATGNFSTDNKIGEGHFGTIYKGKLTDGTSVAVKRAKKNAFETHMSTEFRNEIETLSGVEHMNLVRYLGYIEENDEHIIILEYVGNGNLREHLSGTRGTLEIADRLQIAIDVAHAVTYLHAYADHPIIHRDIKASNILVTEKLRAKVTDFGFARIALEEAGATHVVTQVKGTAGYLDPEYLKTYQLTEKSDVYSFGVLLVEMVTGRRPIEPKRQKERMSTTWWFRMRIADFSEFSIRWYLRAKDAMQAMQKHNQGDTVMVMDPNLKRSPASIDLVGKILDLAQQCLAPSRRYRPSMRRCAEILWDIRKDFTTRPQMTMPTSPLQSTHQCSESSKQNERYRDNRPEDNKELDKIKNSRKHQHQHHPVKKNMSSPATKHEREKGKVPSRDDDRYGIQPVLDLSSGGSSTNWGLRLIREGAAWDD